jgi:hypothetical protein
MVCELRRGRRGVMRCEAQARASVFKKRHADCSWHADGERCRARCFSSAGLTTIADGSDPVTPLTVLSFAALLCHRYPYPRMRFAPMSAKDEDAFKVSTLSNL